MIFYLVPNESVQKVKTELREELEELHKFTGKDIYVTSAFRENDSKEHGKGEAFDLICPDLSLMDFFLACSRFMFGGIGVYPDWHLNGKTEGGIHVDIRSDHHRALWMGVKDERGKQVYIALNAENLKKYGVS